MPGYDKSEFSLVHESLEQDDDFCNSDGLALTKLAMLCIAEDPYNRRTMKQVVNALLQLQIVQKCVLRQMPRHLINHS